MTKKGFIPAPVRNEGAPTGHDPSSAPQRGEDTIPPRPWSVYEMDGESWGILDANSHAVVVTDSGFYPPNLATARFIVDLVNKAP